VLKRLSAEVQSISVPKWRFFGNLRVQISNIVIDCRKGTSLPGTTSFFDVLCLKIRSGVSAVALFKNPKNE